ncbi:MAG: hypothetical protein KAU03_01255 [Candidatus Altiarchaeales archaeon]|nr:hypothetical protein [Candidatus Altiarchaeales archaeon]
MEIEACSYGTIPIAEFADGKGASFAVNLKAKATARLLEDEKTVVSDNVVAEKIAQKVIGFFGYEYGVELKVGCEIPSAVGLGDSEAVSAAVVLAVAGALAKKHGAVHELRIDKYLTEQFLIIDGRIVDKKDLIDLCVDSGMQFDRTYAGFYGGFVIADNRKKQVLRRGEMEALHTVVLLPKKIEEIDISELRLLRSELGVVWNEVLGGNLYTAMKLNSLLYDGGVVKRMLGAGALTVSRSREGSVAALVRDEGRIGDVVDSVKQDGGVLTGRVVNEEARISVKPKRVVKIREFLELKGDQEFHWL